MYRLRGEAFDREDPVVPNCDTCESIDKIIRIWFLHAPFSFKKTFENLRAYMSKCDYVRVGIDGLEEDPWHQRWSRDNKAKMSKIRKLATKFSRECKQSLVESAISRLESKFTLLSGGKKLSLGKAGEAIDDIIIMMLIILDQIQGMHNHGWKGDQTREALQTFSSELNRWRKDTGSEGGGKETTATRDIEKDDVRVKGENGNAEAWNQGKMLGTKTFSGTEGDIGKENVKKEDFDDKEGAKKKELDEEDVAKRVADVKFKQSGTKGENAKGRIGKESDDRVLHGTSQAKRKREDDEANNVASVRMKRRNL